MTQFEQLAQELGVKITYDKHGLYSGMSKALATIAVGLILSDDRTIFVTPEQQNAEIKRRFLAKFPYMEEKSI